MRLKTLSLHIQSYSLESQDERWPGETLPYIKLLSQSQIQKQLKRLLAKHLLQLHAGRPLLLEGQGRASFRQHRTRVALRVWMGCLSPQFRACISTQRVQKVPWHLGLFVGGPEEAEPWRPVVRQVQPPSVWGRPSAGVALEAAPPARPRDRPAPRSLVTSGRGRPRQGGTQPEDRQAALSLPAPREVMG